MSNDITPGQNSDPTVPVYPSTPPAYEQPQGYAQAPAYPQAQGYPQQAYGGYPAAPKNNTLAIVALISAIASLTLAPFIGSIVAVITGHMSLGQLKTSGEGGRWMALTGVIVGWIGVAAIILGVIGLLLFIPLMIGQSSSTSL